MSVPRENRKEYFKEYYLKNLDKWKTYRMKSYGLAPEDYDKMVENQDGRCLICGETAKLHVDHSHETTVVRGLLCQACNLGLGNFRENIQVLKNAIEYLEIRS
jgi:5-methylcytosine-specific restriction endonuclease McrA